MGTTIYNLAQEPVGRLYSEIIDVAVRQCTSCLLIVRPGPGLGPWGISILSRLEPFLRKQVRSSSWPGTELLDEVADLFYYNLNSSSAEVIKTAADRLYAWCQPSLPEDLCFLLGDEKPWLVSISHERESYFCLEDSQQEILLDALPVLAGLLSPEEPAC